MTQNGDVAVRLDGTRKTYGDSSRSTASTWT